MSNAIYEINKSNFTMINNNVLTSLSSKALKIYILIANEITKPNKTFFKQTIVNKFDGGKSTFDKYWKELKDKGFLIQIKKKDCNNLWCYEYKLTSNPCSSHNLVLNPLETPSYNKTNSFKTNYSCCSCNSAAKENKIIKSIKDFGINLSQSAIQVINKYIEDFGSEYVNAVVEYCFNHNAKYFSYFQKVFNELKSKNLITVESFEADIKARQELIKKNQELKAKRLEQSNKLMEAKLNAAATNNGNKNNNSSFPAAVSPAPKFKKTKFTTMNSRTDWDYLELDCLEDLHIALQLGKITQSFYDKCYDDVQQLKEMYNNGDLEQDEYEYALNEILMKCR